MATALGSMSPPQMSYAPSYSPSMASPAAWSHSPLSSQHHFWAEKARLRPGARFLAMRAASMAMVPEPQKGSQKGSLPR